MIFLFSSELFSLEPKETTKPSKILMIPTEYTPCSLEYCPTGKLGSCGFYQTEQQPHRQSAYDRQEEEEEEEEEEEGVNSPPVKRLGRCVLFESQLDEENDTVLYRQIQQFDCPAILDQRWTQDIDHPILMTADAEGNLNSYGLNRTGDSARLDLLDTYSCCAPGKEDVLCLSLDMSDKRWTASKRQVVCSLSSGEIVLLGQDSEERSLSLVEAHRWKAHGYEAWTCAFDYWHPHSILTGGDDCQLKLWDTRNTLLQPVLVNKQFDGGVTAARSDHLREHLFAVGSYDCKLRVFDARNFREPLMSEDVGGGIWRIKWDESRVLLATMHAGFRVLSLTQEDSDESRADSHPPAVANAYPQKIRSLTLSKVSDNVQLAYGADWFPSGSRTLVAGCSFYDRALYFWNIPSA